MAAFYSLTIKAIHRETSKAVSISFDVPKDLRTTFGFVADDLKRSGGFIPGIRPGSETSEYLDKIMSQITLPGSIFLALIAVFPAIIVQIMNIQAGWALFFGGTSLLIMVGVAIDTMQQVNSYLLNKHYDGLMKTGKNRKSV